MEGQLEKKVEKGIKEGRETGRVEGRGELTGILSWRGEMRCRDALKGWRRQTGVGLVGERWLRTERR